MFLHTHPVSTPPSPSVTQFACNNGVLTSATLSCVPAPCVLSGDSSLAGYNISMCPCPLAHNDSCTINCLNGCATFSVVPLFRLLHFSQSSIYSLSFPFLIPVASGFSRFLPVHLVTATRLGYCNISICPCPWRTIRAAQLTVLAGARLSVSCLSRLFCFSQSEVCLLFRSSSPNVSSLQRLHVSLSPGAQPELHNRLSEWVRPMAVSLRVLGPAFACARACVKL